MFLSTFFAVFLGNFASVVVMGLIVQQANKRQEKELAERITESIELVKKEQERLQKYAEYES